MSYPVTISVVPPPQPRNRLTTAFRFFLAIPHLLLVGGAGIAVAHQRDNRTIVGGEGGLLGALAILLAIVSWFTIVFTGTHFSGIRQFTAFYLRWRARAISYLMLLEDAYPPFGDAPYPTSFEIVDPAEPRDRLTVGLRLILILPHAFVLTFVLLAWAFTTIAAWFLIVIGGEYPAALYDFGAGAMRWRLRVEAYMLLMVDEYPPFSLQ
jgi:hypothetical protein